MLLKSILPLTITLLSALSGSNINNSFKETSTLETPTAAQYNLDDSSNRASSGTYSIFNEVCTEIERLVSNGTLNQFHLKYYKDPYYQIPYLKFKKYGMLSSNWYSKTEDQIKSFISMYGQDSRYFTEFNKKINTPVSELEPNRAVGLYFDGTTLNFIWTSEYLPFEDFNLRSIVLNEQLYFNRTISSNTCSHIDGDPMFELTLKYPIPESNIQLNMTPIGGFCPQCKNDGQFVSYGIGMNETALNISGFSANIDPWQNGYEYSDPDACGTEYLINSSDAQTFTFSKSCYEQKKEIYESTTHCYIELTDIECQTTFNVNFGGYVHAVYFNIDLNLDDIYRVDVNYNLASDNKPWYNFVAASGSMDVAKSLTPSTAKGGLFGLSTYQGLTKGTFKSNVKGDKSYQYRMLLNYDADGWNFFKGGQDESKYTNVHDFKVLRMNFIYKGGNYTEDIHMDPIEGENLSIFDPRAITNVDSTVWKFKQTVEDVKEDITSPNSKIRTALITVASVVGSILLIYLIVKVVNFLKIFFKKK